MHNDYSPESVHAMYYYAEAWEPTSLDLNEALDMFKSFESAGYLAVAGVLMARGLNIRAGIHLHEKGEEYISRGCLIGPYIGTDGLVLNGFKFFKRNESSVDI